MVFVCTRSRWNLYEEYGDESHPGFSCKDFKDRKGEESANGIYWMSYLVSVVVNLVQ